MDLKAPLASPTLVTPALGTPASGVMTNVTGIPAAQVGGVLPVGVTGGSGLTAIAGVTTGSGNVTITDGNLILDAGNGIDFSDTADTSATGASMGSELLDDYEEGTWTVAASCSSGTIAFYSNWDNGRYTKIGDLVHISGGFYVESISSPSGTLTLTGLPFPVPAGGSNNINYSAFSIRGYGMNRSVNALQLYTNPSYSSLTAENLNGTSPNLASSIYASTYILIGGSYKI